MYSFLPNEQHCNAAILAYSFFCPIYLFANPNHHRSLSERRKTSQGRQSVCTVLSMILTGAVELFQHTSLTSVIKCFQKEGVILREQTPMILGQFRMFFHKNCPVCCIDSVLTLV